MDEEFRAKLDAYLREAVEVPPEDGAVWPREAMGAFGVPAPVPITVTKVAAWVEIPDGLTMESVLSRARLVRAPWRARLRWRAERWRERAARRAYRVLAGEWPHEPDPYE